MAERVAYPWSIVLVTLIVVVSSMGLLAGLAGARPYGPALASTNGSVHGSVSTAPSVTSSPATPLEPSRYAKMFPGPNTPLTPNPIAQTALAQAKAAGVPTRDVYVPRAGASPTQIAAAGSQGYVTPLYGGNNPAPIGIADYGLSAGPGGAVIPTILNSTKLQATFDTNATGVIPLYPLSSSPDWYGVQLNAVSTNITLFGTGGYSFWTQNVISYSAEYHNLQLVTNVWNFTGPSLTSNVFYSHGPLGNQVGTTFYYAVTNVPAPIYNPFNITFWMNNSLDNGRNNVSFSVGISSPTYSHAFPYDWVVFNSSISQVGNGGLTQPSHYTADGENYNAFGLTNDFELALGGPGGGSQANLYAADANMTLQYWNATRAAYANIPSAYSYGGETGETVTGAYVGWANSSTGSPVGTVVTGPPVLQGLWNASTQPGLSQVQVQVSPGNAFIFLSFNQTSNFSYAYLPYWAPGELTSNTFWVSPGIYNVSLALSDYDPVTSVALVVHPGFRYTITTHLTYDHTQGIYTPLWAFANSDLANLSLSGAGTAISPYVIFNNQYTLMLPIFGIFNDFTFPVFPGVYFVATNANAKLSGMPSLDTAMPYIGTPAFDALPYFFYGASGVAIVNSSQISGWYTSNLAGNIPYYATFSVVMWNSSFNLIGNDTFLTQTAGIYLYGGNNNTVWRNTFTMVPVLPFTGGAAYNLSLGIEEGESGDTIWNNVFDTSFTGYTPLVNLYNGAFYAPTDRWNITPTPAATTTTLAAFPWMPLSGTAIGNATQGGNYWWDYGLYPDTYGQLPYIDINAGGLIAVGGDYYPMISGAPQVVTVQETGLPAATLWSATVINPVTAVTYANNNTVTASFQILLPNGTYGANGVSGTLGASARFTVAGPTTVTLNFQTTYPVTFSETGLSGQIWGVTVGYAFWNTFGTSVVASLVNGSWGYNITSPAGFHASPASGSVTVSGAGSTVNIVFTPVTYIATFSETGLPSGLVWTVSLNSVSAYGTSPANIVESLANGSYTAVFNASGYTASPPGGLLTVAGFPVNVHVVFTALPTFQATFTESGLPGGTTWSVTAGGTVHNSATAAIQFSLYNGSFSWSVAAVAGFDASPSSGTLVVAGAPVTQGITFTPSGTTSYSVTFSESGLPGGTSWSVNLAGTPRTSITGSVVFSEVDGLYSFTVGPVAGYLATPSSGTARVSGANVTEAVVFSAIAPGSYVVSFNESGLPTGTSWTVTFNGTAHSILGVSYQTIATNGSYTWSVTPVTGYTATPSSGTIHVVGAPVTQDIVFAAAHPITYQVTFTESGLSSGTNWSVTLGGVTKSTTSTQIVFLESNNTYAYTIPSVTGYTVSASSGSVTVAGAAKTVAITFSPSGGGGGKSSTGLSSLDWIVIAVVIALIAIGLAIALAMRGRRGGRSGQSMPPTAVSQPPPPYVEGTTAPPQNPAWQEPPPPGPQ